MRLPITPQISTKDGVQNKNARLTNCLKESKKGGDKAVVRPGLVLDAQASGVGNGLVVFNNELVSVYGATLNTLVVNGESSEVSAVSLDTELGITMTGVGLDSLTLLSDGTFLMAAVIYDEVEEEDGTSLIAYDPETDSWEVPTTNLGFLSGQSLATLAANSTEILLNTEEGLHRSTSVGTWTYIGSIGLPRNFVYANGVWVAATLHGINKSTDGGLTWSFVDFPADTSAHTNTFHVSGHWTGTAWYFYISWQDSFGSYNKGYTTTDLVNLTELTFSFPVAVPYFNNIAYADDGYWYIRAGTSLIYSTDAENYTLVAGITPGWVIEDQGDVFTATSATELKQLVAAVATDYLTITEGTAITDITRSTDLTTTLLVRGGSDTATVAVLTAAEEVIEALATITGDYYDFAQSPI